MFPWFATVHPSLPTHLHLFSPKADTGASAKHRELEGGGGGEEKKKNTYEIKHFVGLS